jgi:hypothetical protein
VVGALSRVTVMLESENLEGTLGIPWKTRITPTCLSPHPVALWAVHPLFFLFLFFLFFRDFFRDFFLLCSRSDKAEEIKYLTVNLQSFDTWHHFALLCVACAF